MPRICSLYNPSSCRMFIVVVSFFSLLCRICRIYPRLTISCSISLEWYALSRHRFSFFVLFLFCIVDFENGLLITMVSTVSIATVTSWVFSDVIIADSGIPSLSVRMCLLLPNLLLSVGLWPVFFPLKVIL